MLQVTLRCLTPHLGWQHVLGLCSAGRHGMLAWELDCLLPAACACSKAAAHAASMMRTVQARAPDKTHRVEARQAYFSAFLLCSCCCSVPSPLALVYSPSLPSSKRAPVPLPCPSCSTWQLAALRGSLIAAMRH